MLELMNKRIYRKMENPWQQMGEDVIVLSPAERKAHELNGVGAFLWGCLEQPVSVEELIERVCQEYDVDPGVAATDLNHFLQKLVDQGLIECQ